MAIGAVRTWNIMLRSEDDTVPIRGYFALPLTPFTMVTQSIDYLSEHFAFDLGSARKEKSPTEMFLGDGRRALLIRATLDPSQGLDHQINAAIRTAECLSFCADFPLSLNEIAFFAVDGQCKLRAKVIEFVRGLSFEVEERQLAAQKIEQNFEQLYANEDVRLTAAIGHYNTGMILLGLEDQFPGLFAAAFMQFYQSIEALADTHELKNLKKFIASRGLPSDLQVLSHQVWRVRHEYFGHSSAAAHKQVNRNAESSHMLSRQVLVARHTCRTLIDYCLHPPLPLVREMGMFFDGKYYCFRGNVCELEADFCMPFKSRLVRILDGSGQPIAEHTIRLKDLT